MGFCPSVWPRKIDEVVLRCNKRHLLIRKLSKSGYFEKRNVEIKRHLSSLWITLTFLQNLQKPVKWFQTGRSPVTLLSVIVRFSR